MRRMTRFMPLPLLPRTRAFIDARDAEKMPYRLTATRSRPKIITNTLLRKAQFDGV